LDGNKQMRTNRKQGAYNRLRLQYRSCECPRTMELQREAASEHTRGLREMAVGHVRLMVLIFRVLRQGRLSSDVCARNLSSSLIISLLSNINYPQNCITHSTQMATSLLRTPLRFSGLRAFTSAKSARVIGPTQTTFIRTKATLPALSCKW
jgi:hypothetical protein